MKIPLMIWGAPGIGKSDMVRMAAKILGAKLKQDVKVIDMRLSQMDPSDLRGIPNKDEFTMNGKKVWMTTWLPPAELPREGYGILFMDELPLAPPTMQAAAYQLILDRKCGSYLLPENWIVIGASNRLEDKAHVFDMARPLKNRFSHVELAQPRILDKKEPGETDWIDWAIAQEGAQAIDERIIWFAKCKPSIIQDDGKDKNMAFATARSVAMAGRIIQGVEDEMLLRMFVSACIGEAHAADFIAWITLNSKLPLDKILKNPEEFNKLDRLDLKYVCCTALVSRYKNAKKQDEMLDQLMAVCDVMPVEMAAMVVRMCDQISKNHHDFVKALTKCKNFKKIAPKINHILG